jgi:hypothetical protein
MIGTQNTPRHANTSFINSGIRSFELLPAIIDTTVTAIDPLYVNSSNMMTNPILSPCTVSGFYWGEDGPGQIEPIVYYYDPVLDSWFEGARGPTNASNTPFSFSTPNGISGIRLGAENAAGFPAGNPTSVYFDNVLIEIDSPARAEVPAEREREFKELILKYKPLGTWAGMLVDYV